MEETKEEGRVNGLYPRATTALQPSTETGLSKELLTNVQSSCNRRSCLLHESPALRCYNLSEKNIVIVQRLPKRYTDASHTEQRGGAHESFRL